jgi:hypothetical protein
MRYEIIAESDVEVLKGAWSIGSDEGTRVEIGPNSSNGTRGQSLPPLAALETQFIAISEDRFRLSIPSIGVSLEIDRLRRDRQELVGELRVRCGLAVQRTRDGMLSIADFNLSSARAASERAKLLAERSRVLYLDWLAFIEEFRQAVLQADRNGQPAVDLRAIAHPAQHDDFRVDGLALPRRHPTIIFGDGGATKSYTALYFAGRMARQGLRVALFDWELAGEDHRDRLERLFGDEMPQMLYARCDRALVYDVDRLRRIVRERRVDFAIYDSIAFACDGPPEAAEVAGRYYRAVRQIGVGSLHIAHINKSDSADQKPFGSAFWHNGARSTWFVQRIGDSPDCSLRLKLVNRKSNLGRLQAPISFEVSFTEERTLFRRVDIDDSSKFASRVTVVQRIIHLLKRGSMTVTKIANELELDVNTVTQTLNRSLRKGSDFIVLDGEDTQRRIGLLAPNKAVAQV